MYICMSMYTVHVHVHICIVDNPPLPHTLHTHTHTHTRTHTHTHTHTHTCIREYPYMLIAELTARDSSLFLGSTCPSENSECREMSAKDHVRQITRECEGVSGEGA